MLTKEEKHFLLKSALKGFNQAIEELWPNGGASQKKLSADKLRMEVANILFSNRHSFEFKPDSRKEDSMKGVRY